MSIHRRDLLKAGLTGLPLCGLPRSLRALGSAVAQRRPIIGNARMLYVYLRGGADPLNMLVPREDPYYYTPMHPNGSEMRPNIKVDPTTLLNVPGYPALGLNPQLAQLLAIDPRKIAYVYRTGNPKGERSHFTEQHLTETGRSKYVATDSGWISQAVLPAMPPSVLKSVSLSKRLMRSFLSVNPATGLNALHLQTPYDLALGSGTRDLTIDYGKAGTPTELIEDKVLDSVQSGNPAYNQTTDAQYLRNTVANSSVSLDALRLQLDQFQHDANFPLAIGMNVDSAPAGSNLSNDDIKQGTQFFARLEEAVNLLTRQQGNSPLANVAGVEIGGWDNHANQVANQEPLLRILAQGLKAAYDRLNADNDPFLIWVGTEFGRTVKDNGNGTDHGNGGLTLLIGSGVDGGVWNAHSGPTLTGTWTPPLHPSLERGAAWRDLQDEFDGPGNLFFDALDPATDFRLPLIEIAEKFFCIDLNTLPEPLRSEWQAVKATGGLLDFL